MSDRTQEGVSPDDKGKGRALPAARDRAASPAGLDRVPRSRGVASHSADWQESVFAIGCAHSIPKRAGWSYRGVGLHREGERWCATHLNTGFLIAAFGGDNPTAFVIATEIAEAGDWDFDGVYGWQNQFPDVLARMQAIAAKHEPLFLTRPSGARRELTEHAARTARAVLDERLNAQAIEARRAETGEDAGSVQESAVAESDAPTPSLTSSRTGDENG